MDFTIKINSAQAEAVARCLRTAPSSKSYSIAQPHDDTDVIVVVDNGNHGNSWTIGPDGFVGHFSPAARRMLGLSQMHRDEYGIVRMGPDPKQQ